MEIRKIEEMPYKSNGIRRAGIFQSKISGNCKSLFRRQPSTGSGVDFSRKFAVGPVSHTGNSVNLKLKRGKFVGGVRRIRTILE